MKTRMLALLCATLPLPASAYVIDGQIADWGLQANGQASGWTPNAGVQAWTVEDQTGGLGTYLNPGYGGQLYDAEALYLDWDNTNLYVMVVVGMPQSFGDKSGEYAPGNIAFDFGRDGIWEYGLVTKTADGLNAGWLYRSLSWKKGLWDAPGHYVGPGNGTDVTAMAAGTNGVAAQFAYSASPIKGLGAYINDNHYVIEAAIPVSTFGSYWGDNGPLQPFDVQWTMLCGNDVITVDPPLHVPEPASALLVLLGLVGVLPVLHGARRRGTSA